MSQRYSNGYLPTTEVEVYRCIGSPMVVVGMFATNAEASTSRQITVQHVPADETPDDKFAILSNSNISAKGAVQVTTPIIIHPGEAIYAKGSVVDKVVLTIYVMPYADFLAGRF